MAANEKKIFRGYIATLSKHMGSNLFKAMILAFIGLLAGVSGALAASVNQGNGYGPIIYRGSGGQDYEPSAVLLSSELRVWTCGISQQGTDTIFLTIFDLQGNRLWGPYQVLSNSPGYADSQSACSPSVL